MDLFIWNDYEWKLIEKSDEYDKNFFFIVRKLFVQWPIKVSVFERYFSSITYYIINSIRFDFSDCCWHIGLLQIGS